MGWRSVTQPVCPAVPSTRSSLAWSASAGWNRGGRTSTLVRPVVPPAVTTDSRRTASSWPATASLAPTAPAPARFAHSPERADHEADTSRARTGPAVHPAAASRRHPPALPLGAVRRPVRTRPPAPAVLRVGSLLDRLATAPRAHPGDRPDERHHDRPQAAVVPAKPATPLALRDQSRGPNSLAGVRPLRQRRPA